MQLLLPAALAQGLRNRLHDGEMLAVDRDDPSQLRLVLPLRMRLHGGRTWIISGGEAPARPDPVLIRALRAAHAMFGHDAGGEPMLEAIPASPYHRRLLRLAFLAPDLQQAILAGRQPPGLTLKHLLEQRLPLLWSEQFRLFDPATPADPGRAAHDSVPTVPLFRTSASLFRRIPLPVLQNPLPVLQKNRKVPAVSGNILICLG